MLQRAAVTYVGVEMGCYVKDETGIHAFVVRDISLLGPHNDCAARAVGVACQPPVALTTDVYNVRHHDIRGLRPRRRGQIVEFFLGPLSNDLVRLLFLCWNDARLLVGRRYGRLAPPKLEETHIVLAYAHPDTLYIWKDDRLILRTSTWTL